MYICICICIYIYIYIYPYYTVNTLYFLRLATDVIWRAPASGVYTFYLVFTTGSTASGHATRINAPYAQGSSGDYEYGYSNLIAQVLPVDNGNNNWDASFTPVNMFLNGLVSPTMTSSMNTLISNVSPNIITSVSLYLNLYDNVRLKAKIHYENQGSSIHIECIID